MSQSNSQGSGNAYLLLGSLIIVGIAGIISSESVGLLGIIAAVAGVSVGIMALAAIQGKGK